MVSPATPGNLYRLIGVFLLSLGVLAAILLPLVTGGNQVGVGAEVLQRDGRWVVIAVDSASTAALAGLQIGDRIVAIDGHRPRDRERTTPGLSLHATRIWTVQRGNAQFTLRPDPGRVPWSSRCTPFLLLVIALTFWATATGVRLRRPQDKLAGQLYRFSLSGALAFALSPAAGNDQLWAMVLEVGAFALLPTQFLAFCFGLISADQAPPAGPALLIRGLRALGIGVGVLYVAAGLAGSAWYNPIRQVLLALLALAFVGGVLTLCRAYWRPPYRPIRRQVRVVLIGMAAAVLPLTGLAIVPEVMGQPPIVQPQLAALSAIFLPLALSYAILKHSLLDIQVAIRRGMIYAIMTLLLASCYALFLYWLEAAGLKLSGAHTSLLSLAFFAAVAVTFMPVRNRVAAIVDQMIFRDRYDYACTLQRYGTQLASVRPLEEVLTDVIGNLTGAMNLCAAAALLRRDQSGLAVVSVGGDLRDDVAARSLLARAGEFQGEAGQTDEGGYWQPLLVHDRRIGLLYLGPKRSGAGFSADDLRLVKTLASQAAVAIANAQLVDRLEDKVTELGLLRDRLLAVRDAERKRLAYELHDSVLQGVLALLRHAEVAALSLPPNADELCTLRERLRFLEELARDVTDDLRVICADLYPSVLEHLGLAAALTQLARVISRDEYLEVRFSAETFLEEQRLPTEIEEALYRITREALANAVRHARARIATVSLAMEQDQVTLLVADDGWGFAMPESAATLLRAGHLGLVGMREQAARLGGICVVTTAPGAGTSVRVRMPVPDTEGMEMTEKVGARG